VPIHCVSEQWAHVKSSRDRIFLVNHLLMELPTLGNFVHMTLWDHYIFIARPHAKQYRVRYCHSIFSVSLKLSAVF